MEKITDIAQGHWPLILSTLAGLSKSELSNTHGKCPLCGGKDRYRFDDQEGRGTWFCNKCGGPHRQGGGGTGMDMLLRKNDWTFSHAATQIRSLLNVNTNQAIPAPPTKGAENVYQYSNEFYVCRFPGKKIRPLWYDGQKWNFKAPPSPRPIYNLQDLKIFPDKQVLITEGEKAATAAAKLLPDFVSVTWSSGCKAFDKTDWSPLKGRTAILWPDADEPGRQAMAKLAPRLLQAGAEKVYIVSPPENAPEGWDLADAIWSPEEARSYLDSHLSEPITLPPELTAPPLEPVDAPEALPEPDEHFICIGFQENTFYYLPFSTGQVLALGRSSHTGTNLCAIAPLSYWENLYPNRTGVNWIAAASSLFQRCHKAGFYDPARLRGRGAWWDNGRSVLHLGDRIIVDGEARPSNKQLDNSSYYYQRLIKLKGPDLNNPLSKEESSRILEIAGSFLWEKKASGLLMTGWIALAPVCGILDWRPHVWLTAGAGSGKSTILEDFVSPLLSDMKEVVVGNTSEAGIRQALKADARPVIYDEAESNEKSDQARIQSILSLARVASFESDANILKGSPDGAMQNFKIRSMFMFSSIASSLKQNADKSRFAGLTLKNPKDVISDKAKRAKHWDRLQKSLANEISSDVGRRLQARTFSLIPVLQESIKTFKAAATECLDGNQRNGDQYGTLMAGAWIVFSDIPPTQEEAAKLCVDIELAKFCEDDHKPEERECLDFITQHQLKVEGREKTVTRTIGELIEVAADKVLERELLRSEAEAVLGRNGIKVAEGMVYISNTSKAIASIFKNTSYENGWKGLIKTLPGASTTANSISFKGAGSNSRAVGIPLSML